MESFSVIIPTHSSEDPNELLSSLRNVQYPKDKIEIIIARGTQPSRQRNEAVKVASNDIIYFLDDDVFVSYDIFTRASEHYRDKDIIGVGGPNLTPKSDSFLQKVFGYIMASPFGSAGMRNRYVRGGRARYASEKDLILCNFSILRSVFEKEKFSEKLYPNEENELFERLSRSGYKLIYDPNIVVYHHRRKSLLAFSKQVFNYGRGRLQIFQISSPENLIFLLPSLFLVYIISLMFYSNFVYMLPIVAYIILAIVSSFKTAIKESNILLILVMPPVYLLEHLSYGAGFIFGFFKNAKRTELKDTEVEVTKFIL